MLVLTIRPGGQLRIADDIVVTVVGIDRNKVRLGVDAPSSIRVDRKEVHDRRVTLQQANNSVQAEFDTGCPVG